MNERTSWPTTRISSAKKRVLGREVGVERAHGESGGAGDLVDVGREVALLADQAPARGEQALAGALLERHGQGLAGAAEDGGRVPGHAGEEPARRMRVQVLDAASRRPAGRGGWRRSARRPRAKRYSLQTRVAAERDAQARAGRSRRAGARTRRTGTALRGRPRPGRGDPRRSRRWRRRICARRSSGPEPPARFDRLPDHVEDPREDAAEEVFLVLEVSIEDTVGQARGPADLRDGHDTVPLAGEQLDRRLDESELRVRCRVGPSPLHGELFP